MAQKDENWPERLDADIQRDLGVETETFYDLLGSMRYVTTPKDGETPLTDDVHQYIENWMNENRPVD